jgi:dienelactone hydrolase
MKAGAAVVLLFGFCAAGLVLAQDYAAPPAQAPSETTLKAIEEKTTKLGQRLQAQRREGLRDPQLAEIEIYFKAASWIRRHNEFYHKDAADWTLEALDRGALRADQAGKADSPWLKQTGQAVVRAYRSRIDGSVQPYAVTLPADYGKEATRKWRVDVVLHGRDSSISEVKFLHAHNGSKPAPSDRHYVQIDIYGRGNNAYRWAGEMDVLEAIENFVAVERLLGRDQLVDFNRFVLRGFSMGGAGTWGIGLHTPDKWCALGPGAGFTTTHGYIKNLPAKLPPEQEACLHIYDAVDYAENAFNVPIVAYGGDQDPQLAASRNIEARLKPLGIPMTHIIAPGLAHQFPPEWQKKAEEEYARHAAKGRSEYPRHVRFITYTLKYNTCYWVDILGLYRHFQRALVDATQTETGFNIKTENVRALHLAVQPGIVARTLTLHIDDQELEVRPYLTPAGTLHVYLERPDKNWRPVLPEKLSTANQRRPRKLAGLQGPIDDAFTRAFLCVRGTGKPWHEATQRYADANLPRFGQEWNKYLRGELPVKDDIDVTPEDIAERNLILFGDPASNSLIAQVIDSLPLLWTKERITLSDRSYASGEHVPVLIYPSPLNAGRYVVLNSGHTFHAADFQGTNALLYPRLGDYALLKLSSDNKDPLANEVVKAGLFDDEWKLPGD